jgi:hypothetical protein
MPEDYGVGDAPVVRRPLAAGIQALLTIDLPTAVQSVSRDQVEKWGRPVDELFELGMANVRAQDVPIDDVVDGTRIRMLVGDSFFTTTWALMLERYLEPVSEHGALVTLPHRHLMLFLPILDVSVVQAIGPLLTIAQRQYQAGPGSISPSLYWWRNGTLTLLPASATKKGVNFTPPDEFVQVLNALAEA